MARKPEPYRKTVTRHHTPDGRECKSTDPGAVKTTTETDTYYFRIGGKPVPLGVTDLSAAWEKARKLLAGEAKKDDPAAVQAARPIAEHLDDWLASVGAGDCTAKRLALLRARVAKVIELAGWLRIGDIRKGECEIALAKLRNEPTRRTGVDAKGEPRGRSAQTSNHYLAHCRQFARWLVEERRLASDPLAGAKGVRIETDRRHDRRSPSDEEVRVLFDHLYGRLGKPSRRSGMTGERRALGYAISMSTGLRAGELRSLRESSFDLESGTIRLRAGAAKARKRTLQPAPRWLCDQLASWFAGGNGLWEAFPASWPGRLLQADLAAARDAWVLAGGSVAEEKRRLGTTVCVYEVRGEDGPLFWDFHALRHWYISQVAGIDGIAPSTMQALVRHSDPKLTLITYAKARGGGVRDAADSVRVPGSAPDEGPDA